MSRLLIVSFRDCNRDQLKLRIDRNSIQSYDDVIRYLHEYSLSNKDTIELIEILNTTTGRYEQIHSYADAIDDSQPFLSILVKTVETNNSTAPRIVGRRFDLSDGISINGHQLVVSERQDASLGTGLKTWDGAIVLAKFLESHPSEVAGKRVLELGAGTGVAGIAAGLVDAKEVLLTDLAYTLENVCDTIVRNNLQQLRPGTYSVSILDWSNPSTYPISSRRAATNSNINSNNEEDPIRGKLSGHNTVQEGDWDVILGADVVWLESLVLPLVQAMAGCSHASTTILLAHQTRSKYTDELLFGSLAEHFSVQELSLHTLEPMYKPDAIKIFKCTKR